MAKLTKLQSEIISDLRTLSPERFVSMRVLEPIPFIFNGDGDAYREWRHDLGTRLKVDPRALAIVGSAAAGVSLSPRKNLAPFHADSDVDVAVISMVHFELGWQWLRQLGADLYALPPDARASVKDHRERLIYWATIATDVLIGHMPVGTAWVPALAAIAQVTPPSARTVNVRLYRDFEALRAYQAHGVTELSSTQLVRGGSA